MPLYNTPQPNYPGFGSAESSYVPEQVNPMDKRRKLLMALAGGLGAGAQPDGFFGNLTRSFGGAVGGTMKYHEQEREEVRQTAEAQRQAEAAQRAERQIGISQGHLDVSKAAETRLATKTPEETEADFFRRDPQGYSKYKAAGRAPTQGRTPSMFERWLNAKSPGERAQIETYMRLGKGGDDDPEQVGSETTVLERDASGMPNRTRNSKVFEGDDTSAFIDEAAVGGNVAALHGMAQGQFGDDVRSPAVRARLQKKARAALGRIQMQGR